MHFKWVKGQSGVPGNEEADRLANKGTQKPQPDHIDLSVPTNFNPSGMKLHAITQHLVYTTLSQAKPLTHLNTTTINLELTRDAVHEHTTH